MTARITVWNRLGYAVMRAALAVVGVLPEGLAYRVVGWAGQTYVRFSSKRQKAGLRMLRNAYPNETDDRKLLRLARLGTGNLLKVSLDMMLIGKMVRTGRFSDRIDMSELAECGQAPPWVGVTGHLGSWECGAMGVAGLVSQAHVTARLIKNPLAQAMLLEARRRGGLIIHDRRGGVRGIAPALAQGHVVMQVVDQHQRLRGVTAPFFGEPASCERAAATLAVRRSLPVMVAAGIRTGVGFRFKFVIQEILQPEPSGDLAADVQRLVERMNAALEQLILRFPEQYLWIHNRYRESVG